MDAASNITSKADGRIAPWNKGKLIGQKPPLELKEIWAIRIRLQLDHRARELALFNLAIDSKLRGCDLVGASRSRCVPGQSCRTTRDCHAEEDARYAERREDAGISDFTFGNPHEMPLTGLVAAIREAALPQNKDCSPTSEALRLAPQQSGTGDNAAMARLKLFAFRYRDARTGKWLRARYLAERHEIAARYAELELIEPPELREIRSDGRYFTPFSERGRPDELPLEMQPTIDGSERFLAQLFLRRYITYCVGDRRFATLEGAACLCAAIR